MFWMKRVDVFEIREGENYFCRREFKLCRGMFSEVELPHFNAIIPHKPKKRVNFASLLRKQ